MARGAVVRGRGDRCAQDHPARAGGRRQVDGLDILFVGADVADVGKREGDDLARVGRIGEDFLISGHRGVEADLAHRMAGGAKAMTFQHRAVGEHQHGRGRGLRPAARGLFVVHEAPT